MIERVCVIGAGVIGSLFAGHLADVSEVSVLTRREDHADALNRDGLRITGRSDRHATLFATADPDELPAFDVGIDGQAVDLSSPLRFVIRAETLRVRISSSHAGVSRSARLA